MRTESGLMLKWVREKFGESVSVVFQGELGDG